MTARYDTVAGLGTALAGAVLVFAVIPAQTTAGDGYGMPPAFMPTIVSCAMIVLGLALTVSSFRSMAQRAPETTAALTRDDLLRVAAVVLVLSIGILAIAHLGYLAGAIGITAALLLMAGLRRFLLAFILSLSLPITYYVLVQEVLGRLLP